MQRVQKQTEPKGEDDKSSSNGESQETEAKAEVEKMEAKPEPSKLETPKPDERALEIVKKATALYEAFKAAGFSRDSYIELGESVKHGKTFKAVHPVVQHLIMKVAKQTHGL